MRNIKFRAWDNNKNKIVDDIPTMLNQNALHPQRWGIEIMQFTGLHDKNGKEIYEGDIVMAEVSIRIYPPKKEIAKIEFRDLSWRCQFKNPYDEEECYLREYFSENIEVIGNIYEDENLLIK